MDNTMPEERDRRKEPDAARRGTGAPRALAASIGALSKRVLGKRGFAEAELVTDWASVVGPELAAGCQPERLSFPAGKRDGGTLRILVTGGFATELQHMEPMVLDRINGYFGYRAVARLTLVHAAPPRTRRTPRNQSLESAGTGPDAGAIEKMEADVARVDDPELRSALVRLGQAILAAPRRGGKR